MSMSFWGLTQSLFNLIFLAGMVYLWVRAHRPAKDDPRLSRGLQLLQSKISVLEDLSDRVEQQTNHFSSIVQQKLKELQEQIAASDKQVHMIEESMRRSLDVAKIFQDKIPHEEIIERQNTIKYVRAAKLAYRGLSIEEIAKQVDLPLGEIDFIAKVNRNELQFEESELPDWARDAADIGETTSPPQSVTQNSHNYGQQQDLTATRAETQAPGASGLSELGERFRNAIPEGMTQETQSREALKAEIQKFEFPQISKR